MITHDKLFAHSLRQAWLANASQTDFETGGQTLQQLLMNEDTTDSHNDQERQIDNRLRLLMVTPTLGTLLCQATSSIPPDQQVHQTGLSTETLDELRADQLHPTSIPVLRMKRLIEFLKLSVAQAMAALQKTAEQYSQQLAPDAPTHGITGRIASVSKTAKTAASLGTSNSRFLFESDEALRTYLNRLENEMTRGTIV